MARRSPLDGEWKAHRTRRVTLTQHKIDINNDNNNVQGPASRTRSSKKRELYELAPIQGGDGEQELEEEHQANIDLLSNVPSKPWIPEKRVFELIIDTLQRRDTHEIFAEPVDPKEVKDYHKIIKEPMDFGTMRAKLHEGMYETLEQFKHDIFLITKNAMRFNASDSIYFREARVLDELASEVFRVLKTHPESFELEILGFGRKGAKRSKGEARNLLHRTRPKLDRNAKSNSAKIIESLKSLPSSSRTLTNIRRRRRRQGISDPGSCFDAEDHEVPYRGASDDRGTRSIEADKRRTYYKPWIDKDESTISLVSSNRKQLEHVIQKDIGYSKSLMSFVKDLGPAVQAIARKKLSFGSNFPIRNCSVTNANERTDVKDSLKGKRACVDGEMASQSAIVASEFGFANGVHRNRSDTVSLLSRAGVDSSYTNAGLENIRNKPTEMSDLEQDQPSELDFWRKYSNSSGLDLRAESGFAFESPFSKPRLGQTNAFRRLAFLQRSSGPEANFFNV